MSSWRVLDLSVQPDGEPIPQLLVKPAFTPDSYTLHLTCLTNIWSEQLDLDAIIRRATDQQSPIEVSKQDTAQLNILLDNVNKSLDTSDDTECLLTRDGDDGITLHTTIRLPQPLDSLTWKFHLQKRTSVTLKNELILPLLVSSHIQYERINDLVTTIENKDKAITRMVDQFESSNLDLAAAFPSIGALKAGRKMIKREQAARHVPALRPFQQHVWRQETAQLADSEFTTLGLFQEALVQCTPDVPSSLEADDGAEDWLSAVPSRLTYAKPAIKIRTREPAPVFQPPKHGHESSPVDDTEDEFEVHENFKTRNLPSKELSKVPQPIPPPAQHKVDLDEDESTEDDGDDLDVPSTSQSQGRLQHNRAPTQMQQRKKSPSPKMPSEPATSPPPVSRPKGRGFRIGGKAKETTLNTSRQEDEPEPHHAEASQSSALPISQLDSQTRTSPKKPRKAFRIGGKPKASQEPASSQLDTTTTTRHRHARSPTPKSSPPPMPHVEKEATPMEEVHEETPEEKVERKRAELKRRNEELVKKQAQHKKKKRF
ncbi:hypothetical protein N0V95_009940 [Ascochyta clinopodiicola]|nr:hypothetical protein N0V95_009940 [Ascochyta clinopodiicola]